MENVESLFRCPVLTREPQSRLLLDADILQAAFPHANAITARQCERYWDATLQQRHIEPATTTAARVRKHLLESDTPLPTLREVARAFNQSERGLRRRLQQEGTKWRRLLDKMLQIRAEEKLRSGKLRIREVAEQLGYTEPSSFSLAFKRRTGKSPAEFCREESGELKTPPD